MTLALCLNNWQAIVFGAGCIGCWELIRWIEDLGRERKNEPR